MSLRVLIPTMAWRRIPLLELWAAHHTTLDVPGVEVDVLACGSEPDAEAVARRHGCHYVHAPNAPLGLKAQRRLDATRELDWDFLLFLGSDDFIAAPTLAYYAERMAEGFDFIAPLDLYFWARPLRPVGRRAWGLWHSAGYTQRAAPHRAGEPMAVGRCLSRELVERLDFALWPPVRKHIDRPAWERLRRHVRRPHTFRLRAGRRGRLLVVDVKVGESLSRFDERRPNISKVPDAYMAQSGLPGRLRRALAAL